MVVVVVVMVVDSCVVALDKRLAVASKRRGEARQGEARLGVMGRQKSVGEGGQDADRHSATLLLSTLRVLLPLLPAWSLPEVYRAAVRLPHSGHSLVLTLSLARSLEFCTLVSRPRP